MNTQLTYRNVVTRDEGEQCLFRFQAVLIEPSCPLQI